MLSGVSQSYLRYLSREYEGQLIEIRGELFILQPSPSKFEPRRLVRADSVTDTGFSESRKRNNVGENIVLWGGENGKQ